MTNKQYKKWYFKNHNAYERKAYSIIRNRLKAMLVQFDRRDLTEQNYQKALSIAVSDDEVYKMLNELYFTIGVIHGNRIYKGIQNDSLSVKRFTALFNEVFQELLTVWLRLNAGSKIISIRDSFIKTVTDFISGEVSEGKNLNKITKDLVNNFGKSTGLYKWQMERIVRTETAAAANYAALQAMEHENLIIDKVWLSTDDSRTRGDRVVNGKVVKRYEYDHIQMDGVTIPKDELFVVRSEDGKEDRILFPSDPRGKAGNVINCRCTIAPKPRRDENGRLVLKGL